MSSSEIQHARDYVTRVKTSLGQNSNQYKLFLTTLKSYRTRQLSPTQVISRINDIFSEDNVVESGNRRELILGFNWFLPPEYQLSADDITTSKSNKRKKKDTDASRTRKRVRAPIVSTSSSTAKQSKSSSKGSNKKETTSKNIKVTSYASVRPSSSSTQLPKGYSTITKNLNKKKINISTTEIILSPPKTLPSDLLHVTDTNTKNKPNYNLLNSPAKSIDSNHSAYTEHVECKLCNGARDEQAVNEPVLLCELKGCNAEYHLGCLYAYCPNLFDGKKNGKEKDGSEKDDVAAAMEVEFVAKGVAESEKAPPQLPQDQPPLSHDGELQVPSGDIYCTSCYTDGSTSLLTKYFDKTDNDRSNYTCNRAYVMALLEKHMRLNPTGNMGNGWDNSTGLQHLKAPPRSELWYAHEVNVQALGIESNDGSDKGKKKNAEDINDEFVGEKGAEMLVGKSVRLYNNLDNEYHVGRIVDWRACTVYPPLYEHNDGPHVTKNNTVQLKDLEFYGIGSLSTTEFLVRFPAGLQGRKKELLRWIMLEEHSLAVGVSLIEGKTSMKKAGGVGGGTTNIDEWKPAMVLARSALELVTVRQFLKEDNKGNLFAAANMTTKGKSKGDGSKGDDRWALASFFGEEQHELLHLRDEARDLTDCPSLVNNDASSNGENGSGNGQATKQEGEEDDEDAPPPPRGPLASVDVPLSLALAEHNEQERCKGWSQLILQESGHPQALLSPDEYSMQLSLDKKSKVSESNGSTVSAETNGDTSAAPEDSKNVSNSSIRPLIQRGMDRLWLAQLVEKAAASSASDDSMQLSKDTIMSFKYEYVPSMATAMTSLQKI